MVESMVAMVLADQLLQVRVQSDVAGANMLQRGSSTAAAVAEKYASTTKCLLQQPV